MKSHITTAFQSWPASQSHQMWQFWRPQLYPGCLQFTEFNEQLETIMAMGVLSGAERSGPLGVMTGVSVWVPFSPNVNERQMGSVTAPPLSLHTCSAARTLPRCREHMLRTHAITASRTYLAESAEVKGVCYPSVTDSVTTSGLQDSKYKNKETITFFIAIFFLLLQRHFSSRTQPQR